MRLRPILALLVLLVLAPPASAQEASVSYELTIESPGPVATGTVAIRVRVSGGVRDAEEVAAHLRTDGPWRQDETIPLQRVDEAVFETMLDTAELPNAAYRLEVRAWGDVPPYDPDDPRTFARTVGDLAIDNAPPTPPEIKAQSPADAIRVGWTAVDTAGREDFVGYRIFRWKGRADCPADPPAYTMVAEVAEPLYAGGTAAPGEYCVLVASVRRSAVSDVILSPPTGPVRIRIIKRERTSLGVTGTGPVVSPPAPPELGEGHVEVSDGEFLEDLPYDPQVVTDEVRVRSGEEDAAAAREAGVDPRRTPTLLAAGLVLAVLSLLIQRFLFAPRLP